MFKPLEIVGDAAVRTTDQKVRGSNPFERAEVLNFIINSQKLIFINLMPT
jgi:hypothetical protein